MVLLTLVEEAEHHTVALLRRSEHTDFVIKPEQLDRPLHVAHELVQYIFIRIQLTWLSQRRGELYQCCS